MEAQLLCAESPQMLLLIGTGPIIIPDRTKETEKRDLSRFSLCSMSKRISHEGIHYDALSKFHAYEWTECQRGSRGPSIRWLKNDCGSVLTDLRVLQLPVHRHCETWMFPIKVIWRKETCAKTSSSRAYFLFAVSKSSTISRAPLLHLDYNVYFTGQCSCRENVEMLSMEFSNN